ncbi:MAG TPA: M14 family metallopeptidase [Candidatus Paceibacterota bacterium]|nr:M14 family metallopeptidase [Candidatus Paceibacterota bacterium]
MKKIIGIVVAIAVLAVVAFLLVKNFSDKEAIPNTGENNTPVGVSTTTEPTATSTQTTEDTGKRVIGKSVEGRDIVAYSYGTGNTDVLFIGGIHGGYEWNTALVGYELVDFLNSNPSVVPENVKVTVIPVMNPDGLNKVVGTTEKFDSDDVSTSNTVVVSGRFNANNVDLNRNFDCDWKASAMWQNKTVSGGTAAFSEPESQAIKAYVEANKPEAVVVWYSAAGGVYASNCHGVVSEGTLSLMNTYAKASGYSAHKDFNFYEITGDMVNWFAKNNIPAISVLLTNHEDVEWNKNRAGIEAILRSYNQ